MERKHTVEMDDDEIAVDALRAPATLRHWKLGREDRCGSFTELVRARIGAFHTLRAFTPIATSAPRAKGQFRACMSRNGSAAPAGARRPRIPTYKWVKRALQQDM